jgi:hypothetical protein
MLPTDDESDFEELDDVCLYFGLSGREIDGSNQQRKEINNRLKHNV